ncbi:heme peroxidase [Lentinus tigrinus ALCF2SS1-6]|uniref:Peroxidase n=1 Tax=Lentinus tigrinus ALCF2SS1-6 TaxID=1328759 RepID=A0A5C2SGD3_9APHY|nr:heme peroxidase [Lentinus tigrinus ALCF2SS1-6]
MQCPYAFLWLAICAVLTHAGRCNDHARQSLRITFHDAIGRSSALWASGSAGYVYLCGGADGSLIKFSDLELTDPANKGLHDIINSLKHIADHYDVSYGDIIQFAGAVGFSNCPGATRLEFFAGRPEATAPAPPKLIPGPTDTAQATLSRMQDAGFSAEDTVILLGAHSVGREHTIDPAANDTPLDSTPGAFDSQFYLEVLLKGTVYPRKAPHSGEALSATKDVFRLSSDAAIARHPDTACHDDRMRSAFRKAMIKVATLGHRMEDLVDCSHVIPVPPPWNKTASYPAGFSTSSVERSVSLSSCPGITLPAKASEDTLTGLQYFC